MSSDGVTPISVSTANDPRGAQRISLTLSNETGNLTIECDVRSMDEGVSMVQRALCQLETRLKFELGKQIAVQEAQNRQLAGVAAAVARGGGRGV